MTPALYRACARAVHVITPAGRVLRAGRAGLYVLGLLGWPNLARALAAPLFVWAVEAGYRLVATHRAFFGRVLFRAERTNIPDCEA